jgi:subtilisin-like proprotein convertase family protein
VALEVGESAPLASVKVQVDIQHTYIGDLVVQVIPPASMQASAVTLHTRTGGGTKNLRRTYDALNAPDLNIYQGKSAQGTWQLAVHDAARADVGTINSFGLELIFAPPVRTAVAPARKTAPSAAKAPSRPRPARKR